MQKTIKYTIFKTKWGYFGLAGTTQALLRTHLPATEPEKVKSALLSNLPARRQVSCGGQYDKTFFKSLQHRIAAYFEAGCENFDDITIVLDGLSTFAQLVLTACRDIAFSQTISYGQLAKRLGRAGSARAVGAALAKNPLPLIIPCHRVICANGKVGGFSAAGGTDLKKKLLALETNSAPKGQNNIARGNALGNEDTVRIEALKGRYNTSLFLRSLQCVQE